MALATLATLSEDEGFGNTKLTVYNQQYKTSAKERYQPSNIWDPTSGTDINTPMLVRSQHVALGKQGGSVVQWLGRWTCDLRLVISKISDRISRVN